MKIQTTLVASLLVLSANAYAEHPRGGERHWRGPISISEVEQETEQRFVKLDANGDDQITADEFDAAAGRISVDSPVGRALMGKRLGDEVNVRRPKGETLYSVLKIEYDTTEP